MMKKIIFICVFVLSGVISYAHNNHDHATFLNEWRVGDNKVIGSFLMYKEDTVYIQDMNDSVHKYSIDMFNCTEQQVIFNKVDKIDEINSGKTNRNDKKSKSIFGGFMNKYLIIFGGLVVLCFIVYISISKNKRKTTSGLFLAGIISIFITFSACETEATKNSVANVITSIPANVVSTMKEHFKYFSFVSTSSDETYFYVASEGIPEHTMMVNITTWIAQVPVPQPYTGTNAWPIPLKPELAEKPLSIVGNLQRGAIGVAVNGIPIFNPYNASGLVSKEIGELDDYGGHSGRADDYHYHTAPLHLEAVTGNNPIAYVLDGFAVYGSKEPDGSTMKELDEYHGHIYGGTYHYHGTTTKPYMVGSVRGKVGLDPNTTAPETQIYPQALSKPVRQDPHPIAQKSTITSCEQNAAKNGYVLKYTTNGVEGSIDYSWDANGLFTFKYKDVNGSTSTETFQRKN